MKLIRAIPRPFWLSKKRKPTAALAEAFSFDQKLCPVEDEFAQVPELMALEHQIEMTLNGPDETVMSEGTSEDFSLILDSKYFYSYATNKFYPMPF